MGQGDDVFDPHGQRLAGARDSLLHAVEYALFLGFFQAAKKGLNHLPGISIQHDLSVLAWLGPKRLPERGVRIAAWVRNHPTQAKRRLEWATQGFCR